MLWCCFSGAVDLRLNCVMIVALILKIVLSMSQLHPVIRKIVSGLPRQTLDNETHQKRNISQVSAHHRDNRPRVKVSLIQNASDVSWRSMSVFSLYDKLGSHRPYGASHIENSAQVVARDTPKHDTPKHDIAKQDASTPNLGDLNSSTDHFDLVQSDPASPNRWGAIKTREQFYNFLLE